MVISAPVAQSTQVQWADEIAQNFAICRQTNTVNGTVSDLSKWVKKQRKDNN
jgi:hypothetical protein